MIDRGAAIVIPARPDLNWSPTTQDRVWNTMVKFDQQMNANHTWGVRWLRELSPQRNQAIAPPSDIVASGAIREEDDKDQTVLATFSSVFGSTKLNSLRAGWTQEDVAFANPCFNGNGRAMLPATRRSPFRPSRSAGQYVRRPASTTRIRLRIRSPGSCPTSSGDHDVKFGDTVRVRHCRQLQTKANLNGTFTFGTSNGPFNANDPRTYPDRLTVRVPGQSAFLEKAHYLSFFAQDKWKMGEPPDRDDRPPLRRRDDSGCRERNNPNFANEDDYPVDREQLPAARRAVLCARRHRAFGRARRIRPVLRQDALRDHRRPLQLRGVLGLVYRELPGFGCRRRTAQRKLPDRSDARERSCAEQGAARIRCFRQDRRCGIPATSRLDDPSRRVPHCDELSVGYEHQFGATVSLSADFVRVLGREMFMRLRQQQGRSRRPRRRRPDRQAGSNLPAGQHVPQRRRDRLQRAPDAGREAAVARHSARVCRTPSPTRPATRGTTVGRHQLPGRDRK